MTDINQVFETLKSFEPRWISDSSVQDVTQFLEKASSVLQRTINIVDQKGGEEVFKFTSVTNIPEEPYRMCFVQHSVAIVCYITCWLSITTKNVENTLVTQMEPTLEEDEPDLKKNVENPAHFYES